MMAALRANAEVTVAKGVAKIVVGSLPPFTATCFVTDVPAGWRPIYPDLRQAALADGKQNLVYTTVAGSPVTVERAIEESDSRVRITDSFPEEAATLQLAKSMIIEFPGMDVADAVVEYVESNKADAGGRRWSEMAEGSSKPVPVTCSGVSLTYPSGEKLTIQFDEPRAVSANAPAADSKDLYSFRIAYPEAPSKSTFEFRIEGKGK